MSSPPSWAWRLPACTPADDSEGRRYTVQKVLEHIAQQHGQPEDLTPRALTRTVARIKEFISQRGNPPPP
ncbi:MAG: hypothetical protein U1G07_00725 [Verrucomicrobiota bacterium]